MGVVLNEVMVHYVGESFAEVDEYNKIKSLNLLNGYTIKYYNEAETDIVHEDKF